MQKNGNKTKIQIENLIIKYTIAYLKHAICDFVKPQKMIYFEIRYLILACLFTFAACGVKKQSLVFTCCIGSRRIMFIIFNNYLVDFA